MHPIRTFHSHDEYYDQVFTLFIKSTDQKQQADAWLRDFLSRFPAHQRAVDAGAGNGILTRPVAEHFAEVVAVEPNPSLLAELAASGSNIRILPDTIEEAPVEAGRAEFVLCSHVLYYVPRPEWETLLHRLLSWVQPGGTLIVVLQAENTDCMKFYAALRGHGFPITQCMEEFSHQPGVASVNIVRQPSRILVQSDEELVMILEFLANLTLFQPSDRIPTQEELQQHAAAVGHHGSDGHVLSCDQLFCVITKAT